MAIRKIIEIDEAKCNGCGLCVPNCAEGAIQIIEGKAKLVSDIYCDGLGACLGHCPEDALKIIERDADEFDEIAVEELLKSQGKSFTPQSNQHTQQGHGHGHHGHGNHGHGHHGGGCCPGSKMMEFKQEENENTADAISSNDIEIKIKPQLNQWPVQLKLVPVNAPYFQNADLLITADCVPFAYPNYHLDLLKGKAVVIGCPKLDDLQFYIEKLTQIIEENSLKSVTVAYMEVPCCQGIVMAAEAALQRANKQIPLNKVKIGIQGQKK
ncbi:ATP-binding protein [Alkaliphilus peptidifermentans]|uniref:4Fe-4S binding domain-containing protein n=1 Tax=Alkaliphilus peptidifermentans DSM 18978 TaxID=1120976 RepID=A0A1G5HZY6_9FIRM|nr:4Fe-4S binding protein [Alkaliphilus peptidifermentans]SCY69277.1 4Fe-4S binding domain-containing protein [Alkaliphilus peptidifermentans DSM 18978]